MIQILLSLSERTLSSMSKKNKVIVIIPSYNGQKYWPDLLPTLVREKYDDFDLEVLVVDNNSQDNSADYIESKFPTITVIRNKENTGYVGANNIAYEYAKDKNADFIYLLNQDTEISPGFLGPLYNFAMTHKFGSLQSKLLLHSNKKINTLGNKIHYLGFGYGQDAGKKDLNNQNIVKINYSSGAGVFISMPALKKRGYLFDETMFMYLEDLDLGWSLNLLGYDNYLIPDSVIYHKYEFERSMKHLYWFERNRLWVMLKNYKLLSLILIFPAWIFMELGQILFAVLNKRLGQKLKAYLWLFSPKQWRILLKKRFLIQSLRQRSDRQVVKNFSGQILFQPLNNPLLSIANIIFGLYWKIIRLFIFW